MVQVVTRDMFKEISRVDSIHAIIVKWPLINTKVNSRVLDLRVFSYVYAHISIRMWIVTSSEINN